MGFRKKVFVTYLMLLVLMLILIVPVSRYFVRSASVGAMRERADELIAKIKHAKTNQELVNILKKQQPTFFFRVSIITKDRKVLYDTHVKKLLKDEFSNEFVAIHPEVEEAFCCGCGYFEGDSDILGKRFFYVARCFKSHGENYVIRAAFPHEYVKSLTADIEMGFLVFTVSALGLLAIITWLMLHYYTKPIQEIINAIRPYQEGKVSSLGTIKTQSTEDEFTKLAETLNSLSAKVKSHIYKLQDERNEKKAILESLVEGVIAINDQFEVTYVNEIALDLLCFDKDVDSLDLTCKFELLEQKTAVDLLDKCRKENQVIKKTLKLEKEGRDAYLDFVASPNVDQSGAILVIHDTSYLYRNMEMRRDFISNASHELKTPITVVKGFAETLQEHTDLPLDKTQDILGKIVRNCHRMTAIINDLLTLTNIRHGENQELVEVDVDLLCETCFEMAKQLYPAANITYEDRNTGLKVLGEDYLLESALMNLLQNAGKYSGERALIILAVKKVGNEVHISVKDNGIGISEEDQEHIFQRFYTVDKARSRTLGGAGLGLSIVETIMQKFGGRVEVTSRLGQGSTFTLILHQPQQRKS